MPQPTVGRDRGRRKRNMFTCDSAYCQWPLMSGSLPNSSSSPTLSLQGWYEVVAEWMRLSSPLPSIHYVTRRGSEAVYLPSSGLMACGFMGPVRMGLAVDTGALSDSGRSPPVWWFGADVSREGFPPWSSRGALLTCGAFSCCCCCCCCCSEKNLWVDWSTSARCFA